MWTPFVTFSRVVMLLGLLAAMAHFIFTYRRTRVLRAVSRYGIITLMITFGAMFGFTVLGRIALLIERVATLEDYSGSDYGLFGQTLLSPPFLLTALIVGVLVLGYMGRRDKGTPTA